MQNVTFHTSHDPMNSFIRHRDERYSLRLSAMMQLALTKTLHNDPNTLSPYETGGLRSQSDG